ncbi:unnamed protein product, partial [Polarella glacialis]
WPGARPPKKAKVARSTARDLYSQRNGTFSQKELDFFDLDFDGRVAEEEFISTFVQWAATEHAVQKEKQVRLPRADMSWSEPDERARSSEGEL